MSKFLKYTLILSMFLTSAQVFAFDLDMSVDDEIRKNYNPSELEIKQLPQLPNIDKTTIKPSTSSGNSTSTAVPKTQLNPVQSGGTKKLQTLPNSNYNVKADTSTAIKLKKGTKFKVKSLTKISDANRAGARMSFVTLEPVTQRYITIPAGTVIKGVITESHTPQRAGNGGLIVIKADSIVLKGSQKSLNGKVTKANHKKIFFNNIKGKRTYLANIPYYAKKGKPFYRKMMDTTSKLSQNAVGWILTPFTVISGVAVYGSTIVASPVSSVFSKGKNITIPAGAQFELKLTDDAFME